MEKVIQLENVTKIFGNYAAVDDLTFDIDKGSIFGILGPNGAGKTTTIRMITNIYMADKGRVLINGEPAGPAHQDIIGYLPEERGLYKKAKVIDQLTYFGQLKGLSRADATRAGREWLRKLDAADWAPKKIQELSKGMQQKVQFIATILHDPQILILDELFSGFDPVNVEVLKQVIVDLKEAGKTILLSTHVMEQVEKLCDDICLINRGKAMLNGNVRDIKRSFGRDTVLIEFEGDGSFLDDISGLKILNRSKNRAEFRLTDGETSRKILQKALDTVDLYKYELSEPGLHEIFIDVVSKKEEAE